MIISGKSLKSLSDYGSTQIYEYIPNSFTLQYRPSNTNEYRMLALPWVHYYQSYNYYKANPTSPLEYFHSDNMRPGFCVNGSGIRSPYFQWQSQVAVMLSDCSNFALKQTSHIPIAIIVIFQWIRFLKVPPEMVQRSFPAVEMELGICVHRSVWAKFNIGKWLC